MIVQGIGRTDVGLVRSNNEDSFLADVDLGLYAVCDGMGGHAAGEVASQIAISAIERVVRDQSDVMARAEQNPANFPEVVRLVEEAVHQACRDVYDGATSTPDHAGMGCTATVLVAAGERAAMAHVGDTRLYLIRGAEAHQLSSDHTLAAELVRKGMIESDEGHPHANVLTRALGPQPMVDVEILTFHLMAGDRLLLCSDGLGDYLSSPRWLADQVVSGPLEDLPDSLVEFAKTSGGRDNITVIAIEIAEDHSEAWPREPVELRLGVLRTSFLFTDLTLAQLSRVLDRCRSTSYEAGDIVWQAGEVQDELLILTKGRLEIRAEGRPPADILPGDHLGEQLVLRPRPARASVSATTSSSVLTLDRAALIDLAASRPWLGVALLSRLTQRLSADLDAKAPSEEERPTTPGELL